VNFIVFSGDKQITNSKEDAMKDKLIADIQDAMTPYVDAEQMNKLRETLTKCLYCVSVSMNEAGEIEQNRENAKLLTMFISAKRVEGCSEKTLKYYLSTIDSMFKAVNNSASEITTNDLRYYLSDYQSSNNSSKVTIDNIRRILSSFFSWLEDEDYILKSPVRRIHKVKTGKVVKEVLTDENLEVLRDCCIELRDLAMIDLLASTGMRVGELVRINRVDIDFHERECVVFGKGGSEREVYFDARTKIHLKQYLESRTDSNPALFVSLARPHKRLKIGGVELRLRELGRRANVAKVHPHKFRRTLATMAIGKGMPIEQVQKLLGHVKIDTTMHYAMVNQSNVKISHRKYIS